MNTQVHSEGWKWHKLMPFGPVDEVADSEWTGAVHCSVCGSCPPEALEKALDDGVEVQWCRFLDTDQDELCLYTEELPAVTYEEDSELRASNLYYRHVQTYVLSHLWDLEPEARKRVIDKLVTAADSDPLYIYEQFEVERDV